jgi:hypothetical protein
MGQGKQIKIALKPLAIVLNSSKTTNIGYFQIVDKDASL